MKYKPGALLHNGRYQVEKEIARGGSAVVYVAQDLQAHGQKVALKLELIQGPDLLECINRRGASLPEDEAAYYFCQLLRGLLFMHQTGFAHRDLKPENCVLQHRTGVVKGMGRGMCMLMDQ
eukprot:gene9980-10134_t